MKKLLVIVGAALLVVVALFEVRLDFKFELPRDVEIVDANQEERYAACVELKDREVHAQTFAEIDNPDVQRELLISRMAAAKQACRAQHPEQRVTERRPLEIRLVDLTYRYSR